MEEEKDLKNIMAVYPGYGGTLLGYRYAGWKVRYAIEEDETACKILKRNNPSTRVWCKPIEYLQNPRISYNFLKNPIHFLDFSLRLKSYRIYSPKGQAEWSQKITELMDTIDFIQPQIFILNAETHLLRGNQRLFFNELMELLRETNYTLDYEMLNVKYYETPQNRDVIIVIGIRADLECKPVFPETKEKWLSTESVLEDLIPADLSSKSSLSGDKDVWHDPYPFLQNNRYRLHPLLKRPLTIPEILRLQRFPDDYWLPKKELNQEKLCREIPPYFIKNVVETLNQVVLQ